MPTLEPQGFRAYAANTEARTWARYRLGPTVNDDRRTYTRSRPKGLAPWSPRGRSVTTLDDVRRVIHHDFGTAHWPVTNRQILYRLIGAYGYSKADEDHVEGVVKLARRSGRLPWDAVDDGRAHVDAPLEFAGEVDFWTYCEALADEHVQLHRQDGQPQVTLLWTEAAGLMPQLARIGHPYGVPVYSTSGFNTVTSLYRIAQRTQARFRADTDAGLTPRPTLVGHVGDRDDDGVCAYSVVCAELDAFTHDLGLPADLIVVRRVAITVEQIERHGITPEPPKPRPVRRSDGSLNTPRGGDQLDGPLAQVEALTPQQLAGEVTAFLDGVTDRQALAAVLGAEGDVRAAVGPKLARILAGLQEGRATL